MMRIWVVTAAVGIGLAGTVIATVAMTASAKDRFDGPPGGTFRFQLWAVADSEEGQLDLSLGGPSLGDQFVTAHDVVDGPAKTIGHTNGCCVLTSVVHGDYQCAQTVYLHGSVELAIGARAGGSSPSPLVGGAGQWAGARGEATLPALDPNANRSTLSLRPIR